MCCEPPRTRSFPAGLLGVAAVALVGCASAQTPRPGVAGNLKPYEVALLQRQMAIQLVEQGDYDRALPYLSRLRAAHPADLELRLLLGIVLREKERYGAAEAELRSVVAASPRSAAVHGALGVLLDKMGRHREAERSHRRALALEPRSARWRNDLGFCLFLQQRHKEAREQLELAIRLDPGLRRAYNNLGFVLGLQGDDDGALGAFAQAGSRAMGLTNMGLICELRGRPQLARHYYERALRAQPSYEPAQTNLEALDPHREPRSDHVSASQEQP